MERQFIPETRPQPAYALLSYGEYYKLNHDLSVARGWQIGGNTERVFEMNPQAAKVSIQYDSEGIETGYDIRFVMPISTEIQENHSELLQGIELVSSFTPVEIDVQEIIAEGLTSDVVDWTLQHYFKVGKKEDGLILWLEEQPRSQLSDEAVQQLNEIGITVITIA